MTQTALKPPRPRRITDPDTAIKKYLEVVRLYKGEYLAENPYSEWAFTIRGRYHRQFLQSVLRLLELLKNKGAYEEIINIYEETIAHEPYEESLHIYFLEALVGLGDHKSALSHYNYITGKMYNEMSVRSMPELGRIYNEIVAAGRAKENANLVQLEKDLMQEDIPKGAICCDVDHFKAIYNFERSKAHRMGSVFYLGLITTVKSEGALTDREAGTAAIVLKKILHEFFEKGDVFSRFKINQMLFILTRAAQTNLQVTTKKIIEKFRKEIQNSNISIKVSFQLVGAEDPLVAQGK